MSQISAEKGPYLYKSLDVPKATPCECSGKCQKGLDASLCVNWLSKTKDLSYDACSTHGPTWFVDGKCGVCSPLFPSNVVLDEIPNC